MFCRLFELKTETGINLTDYEHCVKDKCKFYEDNSCSIEKDTLIHLTPDKFGWLINVKIKLKTPTASSNGKIMYTKVMQLVHPLHDEIWILEGMKKDKETNIYEIYHDGKQKGAYKNIKEISKKLINNSDFSYNGRDIKEDDFNF